MKKTILISLLTLILFNCKEAKKDNKTAKEQQVELKAKEFFETFSNRNNWGEFLSFYRDDLEFSDIMLQLQLDSLWKFKRFYDWENKTDGFKKLSPTQKHITIETLIVNDSVAVGRGHLNPFYYNGNLIDTDWGMEFTIWLYFDENLKIKKQVDWMEYDSYTLESTIKRCRENGFKAIPKWLDLSENKITMPNNVYKK